MSLVALRAALEVALNGLPGIIPAVGITTYTMGASATIFTSSVPHLLVTGLQVTISGDVGSTPSLNGTYNVNVIDSTDFTLLNPITNNPIALTATGSGGIIIANLTAWEGVTFTTVNPIPYQRVNLMSALPENPTMGSSFYREVGMIQITLFYPSGAGTADAVRRAELLRSTFKRGATFTNTGVNVNIMRTPEIFPPLISDGQIVVAVRIAYWADIFS